MGLSLVYFTTFGGFLALGLWVPSLFNLVFKTNIAEGGLLLFLSVGTAAIFRPLGGVAGDRIGGKRASVLGLALTLISSLVLSLEVFFHSFYLAVVGVVALGAFLSFANGAVFKRVSEKFSEKEIGTASGVIGGVGGFGGFSITALLGVVLGLSEPTAPLVFGLLAVISMLVIDS